MIEVPQNANPASPTEVLGMQVTNVAGDRLEVNISGGTMHAYQFSPSMTMHGQTAFSPTAHRWLRLRSVGAVVYWDASSDGLTFVPFGQTNDFTGLDRVELTVALHNNGGPPGSVHVDNFNLAP